MSRSALRELSEGAVLTGVELTRPEAAALNGTKLVSVTPEGHGWKVAAGQWVGAVRCGELEVRVASKVGAVKVLELIARAHGIRKLNVDPTRLGLADDADLSAVLAVLFEREAQTALALRPPRGYRTEDQSLSVVRGRIRLIDQQLRRFGALTPIEVTVDEWTIDTDENRRLRAATRVLLSLPGVPRAVLAGLRRVDRMLGDVRVAPRGSRVPIWKPTRLNTHLHRLLNLSDLVLDAGSVEHRAGTVVAHGFALNMAWVFEALVVQLLREQCQREGSVRVVPKRSHPLDTRGELVIEPDIIINEGSTPVVVGDTKYKVLDEKGRFPNADAYQLITYCARLGLPTGDLIYADGGEGMPNEYLIDGAGIRLRVHPVDLRRPLAMIEASVQSLLEVMTSQAPVGLALTTPINPRIPA